MNYKAMLHVKSNVQYKILTTSFDSLQEGKTLTRVKLKNIYLPVYYLTNRFHVAVRLFSNR